MFAVWHDAECLDESYDKRAVVGMPLQVVYLVLLVVAYVADSYDSSADREVEHELVAHSRHV